MPVGCGMELGLGQDAAAGTMVVAVMTDGVRDGQSGQVRDFARGLRLVLVAGDVNAFRGYLGQWDDILGDTTELSGQSDADVRRTMMQLLRRPRQFGLPDWSDDLEEAPEVSPEEVASYATPSGESDGSPDIDYRELDSDAAGNTPGGGASPRGRGMLPFANREPVELVEEAETARATMPVIGGAIEPGNGPSGAGTAIAEVQLVDGAVPEGDAPKAYQVDFVDGELVAVVRGGIRSVRAGARTGRRRPPHGGLDGSTQLGLPMGIDDNSGDGGG